MNPTESIRARTLRCAAATSLWLGGLLAVPIVCAQAQEGPRQAAGGTITVSTVAGESADPSAGRNPPAAEAETRLVYQGKPTAGSTISIDVGSSAGPGATFRWVQIEGPPVAIDDPTSPRIQLTIPPEAEELGFRLTVTDAQGSRTARVIIPIQPASEAPAVANGPRADAGDDQIGLVGRRLTLNGSQSTPRDQVAYRWIQMEGPKVSQPIQDRFYYSFVPTESGVYRFALIVAVNNRISEPDEVEITVGELPDHPLLDSRASLGLMGLGAQPGLDQALRTARSVPEATILDRIAEVFDAVSSRTGLYTSFADLTSEMMRRLDTVIPADPQVRQLWVNGVFTPLTQHMVTQMLSTGIDLRQPQVQYLPLSPVQKDLLQRLFATYAREFRSRSQPR